jgi:hypothetical protein
MPWRNRWWLMLVLGVMATAGCSPARSSPQPLVTDNVRFMDMWTLYTHCSETEDLESMRVDAQILSRSVDVLDAAADPHIGPSARLSADPAAMAASCALRAGQVAHESGQLSVAREMFELIVSHFPHGRYGFYTDRARAGLDQLNASRS